MHAAAKRVQADDLTATTPSKLNDTVPEEGFSTQYPESSSRGQFPGEGGGAASAQKHEAEQGKYAPSRRSSSTEAA